MSFLPSPSFSILLPLSGMSGETPHTSSRIRRAAQRFSTPALSKDTQSTAATTAISKSRAGVLHDAGRNFPLVSVDQFYEHWLPKVPDLPDVTVQDIVAKVKRSRAYVRRRWAAFIRDPEHASEEEEDVFHALVPVIRAIEKVASTLAPHLVPTTKFVTAPAEPPRSTERLNRSRPDAYFVFKDPHRYSATKRALWLDIAITGEFKKKNTRESAFDVSPLSWDKLLRLTIHRL